MCGIAGIMGSPDVISKNSLLDMMSTIQYRGPDEAGIYLDQSVGLGHVRLSIIDLAGGSQPIHDGTKSIWIVYNGEIFNYIELREELAAKGHSFYTTTDTEVLLHAYMEYGPDCLNRFNGQFAFAIWDSRKKELFLARDRVGIRPLYYFLHKGNFYFASEIKALFARDELPREINPVALDQIFTYWAPLPTQTAFKGVEELRPGHYLLFSGGMVAQKMYWDIPVYPKSEFVRDSPEEISEKIQELLNDAIRLRLRADVPVGSYLSGGLDSSGIAALVAKNFNNKIKTFGIRFEQGEFDEGEHQLKMVNFLGVDHSEITAHNRDIGKHFSDVIWHCEKPLLRTSPVPLFLLSRHVRESGLKVVLTGEGADEVFGGYNIFREALIRRFWARAPKSSMRSSLIEKLYPYVFSNEKMRKSSLAFFAKGLEEFNHPLFSHLLRWRNTSKAKIFFQDDFLPKTNGAQDYSEVLEFLPKNWKGLHPLTRAQYLETSLFMSNYLLSSQGDRVAAAHSIEIRVPYLDYRIMEYMAKVPPLWKILGINEKHILKRSFRGILPDSITARSKHPYRAPIQQSLLTGADGGYLEDLLSETKIKEFGIFNPAKTSRLLQKMKSGRPVGEVDNMALVGILSSQIIFERYIKNFRDWKVRLSTAPRVTVFEDFRN